MPEKKTQTKGKKTLSLKLGSKPVIPQSKGIEAGKTVIVEKKRVKRASDTSKKSSDNPSVNKENIKLSLNDNLENQQKQKKSGVVLKPLSKAEQKKLLEADTKEEKIEAIDKIRGLKHDETQKPINTEQKEIQNNVNTAKDITKDSFKRKDADEENDFSEKRKPQLNFGRKKMMPKHIIQPMGVNDMMDNKKEI